jgi:hypothetical protein
MNIPVEKGCTERRKAVANPPAAEKSAPAFRKSTMTSKRRQPGTRARLSRSDWLAAARSALLAGGIESVKVDRLGEYSAGLKPAASGYG